MLVGVPTSVVASGRLPTAVRGPRRVPLRGAGLAEHLPKVDLAVVVLRFREPDRPRPFRIRGCVGRVPVVPVLGLAAVLVVLPALRVEALGLGFALVALGVVVDVTVNRR